VGSGTEAPGPGVVRAGRGLQRRTQPVLWHVGGLPETQGRGGGEEEEDAHVGTATTDQQGRWKTGRPYKTIVTIIFSKDHRQQL